MSFDPALHSDPHGKAEMLKTWTQVVLLNLALIAAGLRAWLSPSLPRARPPKEPSNQSSLLPSWPNRTLPWPSQFDTATRGQNPEEFFLLHVLQLLPYSLSLALCFDNQLAHGKVIRLSSNRV